jgi:hypothetical protein
MPDGQGQKKRSGQSVGVGDLNILGPGQPEPQPEPQPELESLTLGGLFRSIGRIAAGIAGVGGLALLAAGALVPLVGPLATGQLTATVVAGYLGGLGGNALANWLDEWSKTAIDYATDTPDMEERLFNKLAPALQQVMENNKNVLEGVGRLIRRTDAYKATFERLEGQSEAQSRLIELIEQDIARFGDANLRTQDEWGYE